jgi:hypothetical protein
MLDHNRESDAELFALIEEGRRLEARGRERILADEDDTACLNSALDLYQQRIMPYQPNTARGVLAVFDLARDHEYDWDWPEGAIEGLRAMVERTGQAE